MHLEEVELGKGRVAHVLAEREDVQVVSAIEVEEGVKLVEKGT